MVNWKNVLGTSLLSTGLVVSSFAPVAFAKTTNVSKVPYANVLQTPEGLTLPFLGKHTGGPFDIGLVNDEKVLKLLIKQGIVKKDATPQEQQKQMNAYFAKRAKQADVAGTNQQEVKNIRTQLQEKAGLKIKDAKVPKAKAAKAADTAAVNSSKVDPIQKETWDGPVAKDEVLVLLIDYPDAPHSTIKPEDDAVLYYDDYSQQHYEDMIFGEDGYTGPDGQKLPSMKQYYEEQSGGSYTVDGKVSKWYTASQPAAYYGGNVPTPDGNDARPRSLVREALAQAALDPDINLQDYDIKDEFDLDGDGNYSEPDGIIDHLMVVHSGIGEEAGGGSLGGDAIWSHSSSLTPIQTIPNSTSAVPENFGGKMIAYGYTIEPEDGAAGVFAHEFGHDLGLPDEYDTMYTANSVGAPTEYWTIMSAGSWAGKINGTEPTGFSPYDKEYLQSTMPGSNWFKGVEYNLSDLTDGQTVKLDQANDKGTNLDAVKINLPDKQTTVNTPASGQFEYFSGSADEIDNSMATDIDLTGKTSAQLTFKTWYNIEEAYDYAFVEVKEEGATDYVSIPGNITTNDNPNEANPGNGITGDSKDWVDATFDLSAFAGKKVSLRFHYVTDAGVSMPGFYVDDVKVTADGADVLTDDAEGESKFDFKGFTKNNGIKLSTQYYLAEWRTHAGTDSGLAATTRGNSVLTHDPGLVLWYVDNKYTDNWVGDHPGDGFLGVVDAHQEVALWKDTNIGQLPTYSGPASTRYQIHDAAFSLNQTAKMALEYYGGGYLGLDAQPAVATFDDSRVYNNPLLAFAGRNVPNYGLKIHVVGQADDMSVGAIELHTDKVNKIDINPLSKTTYSNHAGHKEVTVSGNVHLDGTGDNVALKYELVDKNGKVVLTESETLTGLVDSFERTLTLPNSATGNYVVRVTATNGEGSTVSGQTSLAVDNDAPTASVAPNGSTTPAKAVAAKVTVKDAEANSLEYVWSQTTSVPATGWSKFTNGSTLKLSGKNGLWYLHVRGVDALGNALKWTSKSFVLDNTAPGAPTVNEVKDYDKKVTGKAEVGSKVTAKVGSTTVGTAYADKYGKFSVTLKKALSAKTVVSVTATDKAGNVSSAATTTVKDKTKPGKPSVRKVDSNDLKVTGKAEAGATVTVKVGSKTVGTAVANSKGEYSVKLKKALKTGTVLTVTVKDKAGNTSSTATVKVVKK